ncbi:hypothetical protein J6590_058206 [Homalodisca vitripennis]|nr:hypothetical protein J6590_058206 [Homalodisca vitripennis]
MLAKDFKRCKKHDPKMNECLKEAIQNALVSLTKGTRRCLRAVWQGILAHNRKVGTPVWYSLPFLPSCLSIRSVSVPGLPDADEFTHFRETLSDHLVEDIKVEDQKVEVGCWVEGEGFEGVPALGVLTIDPLRVTHLLIDQGTGPVSIKLDFNELDIHGLGSARIDRVKVDWDKYTIEVDATVLEPVILDGQYKINGKVLILPIQGNGHSNLTLGWPPRAAHMLHERILSQTIGEIKNVKAKILILGKSMKKNGQEHMDVDKFNLHFTTKKLHMNLENLFNGDKALGDNMNIFLNENWQDILKELQPSIEEALGQTFKAIANRIFHKVPMNQITLPD